MVRFGSPGIDLHRVLQSQDQELDPFIFHWETQSESCEDGVNVEQPIRHTFDKSSEFMFIMLHAPSLTSTTVQFKTPYLIQQEVELEVEFKLRCGTFLPDFYWTEIALLEHHSK